MDPADVAKAGYDALMKGKDKVIAGFSTKLQAAAFRVLPDSVVSQAGRQPMKSQAEVAQDKPSPALLLGIGLAAVALAGVILGATYKNSNANGRARYRYKAGRAYGSAKNTIKSAADSVNGTVANATVESALA